MICKGWCPQCYANVRGRSNYRGHRGYRAGRTHSVEGWNVLRRSGSGAGSSGGVAWHGPDDDLLSPYPGVCDFLGQDQWEDGSPRVTGSLTLFLDDGRLKACVSDKDGHRILFVTGSTLAAILDAVEVAVVSGEGDWRPVRQPAGGGRRK